MKLAQIRRWVSALALDLESVTSMAMQAGSLLLPLVLFRTVWAESGALVLIELEALLALYAFFTIVVEWGTGFLVASERRVRSSLRQLFRDVSWFRLKNWAVCSLALFGVALVDAERAGLYALTSVTLLGSVFTVEYAFLYWREMHKYQATLLLRPLLPLAVVLVGGDPLLGFAAGSLTVALLQATVLLRRTAREPLAASPTERSVPFRRKYGAIAVNDAATAVFSQLDAYFVGGVLPASQAIVYLTIRKLVRAALSVLNYSFRILYSRLLQARGVTTGAWWIGLYSVSAFAGFMLLWRPVVESVMGIPVDDVDTWRRVANGLGLLFVLGVIKGYVVHAVLLRKGRYGRYLTFTLVSLAVVMVPVLRGGAWTALSATWLRLTPDVVFLALVGGTWALLRQKGSTDLPGGTA